MDRRPRGYLLLETMVGSAVACAAVLAALVDLSSAEVAAARASHKTHAARLVQAQLEVARAAGFHGLTTTDATVKRTVAGADYEVRTAVGEATTETVAATTLRFRVVGVTALRGDTKVTATTRLYE